MRNINNVKVRRRKAVFTLLEVLVCMGILALFLATGVPYCIHGYNAWYYEKGVKRLEQKLEAAFAIAKATQKFVDIVFEKENSDIFCTLYPSQDVASTLRNQIQKREKLEGIKDLLKEEKEQVFQKSQWKITMSPQGIAPAYACKIVVVSDTSIVSKEVDLDKKQLSMKRIEDEKEVLQFFPEELQKEFLAD